MTRSPLQTNIITPQNELNRRHNPKSAPYIRDEAQGQRERLTSGVRKRQHSETRLSNVNTASMTPSSSTIRTRITEPAVPVVPSLTPEQMYNNFEEWIKMCTDNKINATNSWNFALIDYFHEMTFIREGDSINFQKASCTLDGCVKIYTSRVDSVASETGKLLSGLADSARDDAEGDDDDLEGHDAGERRLRRKGHRSDTTLLKDFSSIALKKLDVDFFVDPLFKKTSTDFDEGGARGLLLNHLSIDRDCKIIFDASDATTGDCDEKKNDHGEAQQNIDDMTVEQDEQQHTTVSETASDTEVATPLENTENPGDGDTVMEEATSDETEAQEENESQPVTKEGQATKTLIEISRLKAKLPPAEVMADLQICPSLQGYDFFSDDTNIPDIGHHEDHDYDTAKSSQNKAPVADTYNDAENMNPAFDDDMGDILDFDDNNGELLDGIDAMPFLDNDDPLAGDNFQEEEAENEEGEKLDEQDFLKAMVTDQSNELFSYFDSALVKNWAGPEHWKLRRPVSKEKETQNTVPDEEKPKKKVRPAFVIDFLNGEQVDEDELFATDKRVKITMTSSKESTANDTRHLLPDDMHFSSQQLLKLFLKPKNMLINRKKPTRNNDTASADGRSPNQQTPSSEEPDYDVGQDTDFAFGVEPDAQFWANQELNPIGQKTEQDTQGETAAADQTQLTGFDDTSFYQDIYDDSEHSTLYGDPLITSHRLKKVKPLYVKYARTSKRVDVKKLKDNLWKVLTTPEKGTPNVAENEERVHGIRRFTDVIQNLQSMYSTKAMKDISVPFCFICLLHLANEKNLTISRHSNQDDDDDFVLGDEGMVMDETFLNEVTIVQNT